MAIEFAMPKLGHLMEEGTVVAWHKQVGEKVAREQLLVDVQTDKAIVEVESPVDGVLVKILVGPDETVPVGTPLALLEASR